MGGIKRLLIDLTHLYGLSLNAVRLWMSLIGTACGGRKSFFHGNAS
jgi:hypothetical protein